MALRAADPGLHRKLVWLNLFRVVTVTVLLGGTLFVSRGAGPDTGLSELYLVITFTYAITIGFSVALRLRRVLPLVAYGQLVLDVAIATVVVRITGGVESVFIFLFSLGVVNGAILLYRRGALIAATLAVLGYLLAVSTAPGSAPRAATVFVHGSAFVFTAVLASYLAEQLRTTGESLAAITGLHESIVKSMTSGLATLDPGGRVTYLNPAGEVMAGLSLAAIRGRPAAEVFPAFQSATGRGEVEHTSAGGQRMLLGYSSFDLVGPRGRPLGHAVIFQDLTRLRAMEEAVARSARLADLGGVAAGLAHELRNPLASVSGCVELLRAQALDDEGKHLMAIVLRETSRLDRLVAEFLQFSRPAPPRRDPVDLAALLGETLDAFAHDPAAAGLEVVRELRPAVVEGDAYQLRQVAWNLVLNASQALQGRAAGRIVVRSGPLPERQAGFSVEDDGPGMTAAELERIFLPFYTTKDKGTGLGLATVHRIIDLHGGRITVESAPGQGAQFQVFLPVKGAAAGVDGGDGRLQAAG